MFDQRQPLQKISTQHRNLYCLIRFAHSPWLHSSLQCQLNIIFVSPPHPRVISLPQTSLDWEYITKAIVPPSDSVGGGCTQKEATLLVHPFPRNEPNTPPVHCKCSLIQYFSPGSRSAITSTANSSSHHRTQVAQPQTNNLPSIPSGNTPIHWNVVVRKNTAGKNITIADSWKCILPYSYIGVSKLSCATCQMRIAGSNGQGGRHFFIRGSHGKWYWPWGIPQLDKVVLGPYMVDNISDTYYKHCRERHRLGRTSDGSNAAIDNITKPTDEKDENFVAACLLSTSGAGDSS